MGYIEKINTVSTETGEIISTDITTIRKCKDLEEFCQIYLSDYEEFSNLSKAEHNVLVLCWKYSAFYKDLNLPGNKITFDKQLKDIIKEKTGLAESTVKNSFTSLVKKELLLKDGEYKSIYYLNPKFFFKGNISDRTKLVKHTIEYRISPEENYDLGKL